MASAAIFSSLRRRRMPSLDAFLMPVSLTPTTILETLTALSSELISSYSNKTTPFHRKNSRSLLRKISVFALTLESLREVKITKMPSTVLLCFKELYLVLYRSKILLDYCCFSNESSKLWILLQTHTISGFFHDLNQEIYTLLDVFPLSELNLPVDVEEQLELLRKQSKNYKLIHDCSEESLMITLYSLLNDFEKGIIPSKNEICSVFIEKLGIRDAKSCRVEIEFLEELIANNCEYGVGDLHPNVSVLNGFVALMRYCRFLLYGFEEEDEVEVKVGKWRRSKRKLMSQEISEAFIRAPKDFCCPISLDLMKDPVIVSTGQTYDRESIKRWIYEGHHTCPKTGQWIGNLKLISNRALRNLIMQWCVANGIPYDPPQHKGSKDESATAELPSKAAIEANKATVMLLVKQLADGTERAKAIAAREVRLLAKNGKENRAYIAESGAIPHLKNLLSSEDAITQENSVTAMLNLSIHNDNKTRIMDEQGCLESIVGVLRYGVTTEAKENAAATLFSLSAVHDFKKKIADEDGAVEALARLLREGTPRGKKDAVTALYNLSTHIENCQRMINSGAVTAIVDALDCESVAEEAAGALALIVRQPLGAEAVGNEEKVLAELIEMMRSGSAKGKENAVAALLELCRGGGEVIAAKILKAPRLASLLQSLLFTGTKRARRKAASLARVFHRCLGGFSTGYPYPRNSTTVRDSSVAADFTMPLSITVPAL